MGAPFYLYFIIMEKDRFYTRIIKTFDKLDEAEKKRIFTSLSDSYNYINIVFENLEEGVIALDSEDTINILNKQASFLLNIPQNSVGANINDVLKDVGFEDILFSDDKKRFIHDKKNSRFLQIEELSLGQHGSIIGKVIKILDITKIYEREQRLKRAEQLASLTTLAAGVAHEIKNPLGSISIYIQLIEKVLSKSFEDKTTKNYTEMREYCEIVKEEITRLEDTINSFLFSVKSINLEKKNIDIIQLILTTLSFLKYEIENNSIEVDINFESDSLFLNIDERYIKQALINIIQNSVDAMSKTTKNILYIGVKKTEKYAIISIKDTGKGLELENINKIFEPYYTTKKHGTGLGLTNVIRIIEAHSGKIDVNVDNGTEFIIKLPLTLKTQKYLNEF